MKKLAIKAKIILWYTALMAVLMLLVLLFLFSAADKTAVINAKSTLKTVTQDMTHEVELEHGQVDIDNDFRPYEKGALLLALYEGTVVAGQYPDGFPQETSLSPGEVYTATVGDDRWLVYDLQVEPELYVRGIYPMSEGNATWNQTLTIAVIAFPLFILVAALGGYWITRRAFLPVAKIARTAGEIGSSTDLTKRIGGTDSGDEISALSRSFDEMLDRLEAAFAAEKQFTSDVSHELRTPLAVLKSQCEYALDQPQGEQTRQSLLEIQGKINRMTALVAQLLELSRAQHHTEQLRFAPVDVSELLELVTEELAAPAAEKSIVLTAESGDGIVLNCEQTLIMRLMLNLIENAIKYTPDGGCVTAVLTAEPGKLRFSVIDNGIGIPPEQREKIFGRFYQVNPARTGSGVSSFGLGLSFCQWIVDAHHGKIAITDTSGGGSTFTVSLPL